MEPQTEETAILHKYSYESSEAFLAIAQSEYQNELERHKDIDTRLSIALPVISGYFFLLVQESSLPELWGMIQSGGMGWLTVARLIIYILALASAVLSMFYMIYAMFPRHYNLLDLDNLNTPDNLSTKREEFFTVMVSYYVEVINRNARQSNLRANRLGKGWISGAISMGCFVLYTLLSA